MPDLQPARTAQPRASIDETITAGCPLRRRARARAAVFLACAGQPLFLEGEAGVGKTEIASAGPDAGPAPGASTML
jgi:MoxR-like ATPase